MISVLRNAIMSTHPRRPPHASENGIEEKIRQASELKWKIDEIAW